MVKSDLDCLQTKLQLGISKCLLGEKVRYDGGDKRLSFAVDDLSPFANFHSICPESAIGLPTPRPTIGLYQTDQQSVMMRFNDQQIESDIDHQMTLFCQQIMSDLRNLCGYIVCANSPSCGLDNAKVYENEREHLITSADGRFRACLRSYYPWLPIEDNLRLANPDIQNHFVIRLFALQRLNDLNRHGLTRHALLTFHSRYKLLLLAHSQPLYRQIGPFVAKLDQFDDLQAFFVQYREQLMTLLSTPATKENHTNVLMHMQGYFNRYLNGQQKKSLTDTILAYRRGELPLSSPMSCLKTCLEQYPNSYLSDQFYFTHYPKALPSIDNGVT
ncbi:DUF523 and DUF1722 domain-containing protein [Orbus wheelerorum]|uniref:YbgA family protein n=1 Tax=Orbus wheelerorum TaxID=3074111 RepID=UPI00370D5F68